MISVHRPPTIAVSTIRVWMRPYRVGTTAASSDAAVTGPAPPLFGRPGDAELGAEAEPGQVVGDLLGGDLQAEEGVDAGEVAAERRAAGGVHPAGLAASADHLEVAVHVEPADRVAAGAGVVEQVRQHPVLADVGLQTGAVDDEVRVDLCGRHSRAALCLRVQIGDDALTVRTRAQLADLTGQRAVPTLCPAPFELGLPQLADRRVGAAHLLVGLGPLFTLQVADPGLELAAPHRLGVVEALVGPAVAARSALEDVRAVRAGHVRAEDVQDLGLQPVPVPVVDQPLQDAGRDDPTAADDHRAGPQFQLLVHVLVRLVGVDHPGRVPVVLAVALQVGQQLQARVADGDVHERAAVGQPLGGGGPGRRGEDGEVAALAPPADHPDLALAHAPLVADAVRLALHRLERLPGPWGVVVLHDRFGQHIPQGFEPAGEALGGERLPQRVRGKAPDVVRGGFRVGPQPLTTGDLRHPGQVLVALPGGLQLGEHGDVLGRDPVDAQEIDRDEGPDAAADGDEPGVDDRDAGALDHVVGPDVAVDQLRGEVTPLRRMAHASSPFCYVIFTHLDLWIQG